MANYLTATNRYGRYAVPASSQHRPAAQAVLRGEVWEPDTIALMCASCGDGDIVHAGTYFGDFLPALSKALVPGAWLWAFEPVGENYRHAGETNGLNGLLNTQLWNSALGDIYGPGSMLTMDRGCSLGGISRLVADEELETERVTIRRLDDVIPPTRNVTVIQLDVEGYEEQALRGGLELVRRCRPLLILEDWDGRLVDGEWFSEKILPLGYVRKRNVHENAVFAVEE